MAWASPNPNTRDRGNPVNRKSPQRQRIEGWAIVVVCAVGAILWAMLEGR